METKKTPLAVLQAAVEAALWDANLIPTPARLRDVLEAIYTAHGSAAEVPDATAAAETAVGFLAGSLSLVKSYRDTTTEHLIALEAMGALDAVRKSRWRDAFRALEAEVGAEVDPFECETIAWALVAHTSIFAALSDCVDMRVLEGSLYDSPWGRINRVAKDLWRSWGVR